MSTTPDPFEKSPYEVFKSRLGHPLHSPDPLRMQQQIESLRKRISALEEVAHPPREQPASEMLFELQVDYGA